MKIMRDESVDTLSLSLSLASSEKIVFQCTQQVTCINIRHEKALVESESSFLFANLR